MIYLDYGATSYIKPQCVKDAIIFALDNLCGNPGRGGHEISNAASLSVFNARKKVADFFGGRPENTIFTYNTTYAINTALKATYIEGTHILISDLEHNSVLRPVAKITGDSFSSYSLFDSFIELSSYDRKRAVISSIRSKLRPLTKTLVCTARSNVTGDTMPIREIGKFCRERGIYFIVDAAQAAGFDRINVEDDYIDALCIPGHKGLYGPMGTGAVIFSENGADRSKISSFIEGGSGTSSLDINMPDALPEKLEGGTLGVPAICGLSAGIDYVNKIGIENIAKKESELIMRAHFILASNKKIHIYSDFDNNQLLLFNISGKTSEESADELNKRGICVRGGFHCAPLAHKRMGTPAHGAVRMSVGFDTTTEEIDRFAETLNDITT